MNVISKVLILFLFAIHTQGQQIPLSVFESMSSEKFNPAAPGIEEALVSSFGVRTQWLGLEGAPMGQFVSLSMPVHLINSGVGINVEHVTIGGFNSYDVSLFFNYKLIDNRKFKLRLGLGGKYALRYINKNIIKTPEGLENGGVYDFFDRRLDLINNNFNNFSLTSGVLLAYNKWQLGLTFVNFLAKQQKSNGVMYLNRHYICNFESEFELGTVLDLKPLVLFQSDLIEWQIETVLDFNILNDYNAYFGLRGIGNRNKDAVIIGIGALVLDKAHISYIYEYGLSSLANTNVGSHEIMITYKTGQSKLKEKRPSINFSPRYL